MSEVGLVKLSRAPVVFLSDGAGMRNMSPLTSSVRLSVTIVVVVVVLVALACLQS